VTLLDRSDEVAIRRVVALVADLDDRAGDDGAVRVTVDDLGLLEQGLDVADPALHLPLLLLGGVVVAVLRQIAQLAGDLDLAGDLHSTPGRQVVELLVQPVVRGAGQSVGIGHRAVHATVLGMRPTHVVAIIRQRT
jgi:hypothetical protein